MVLMGRNEKYNNFQTRRINCPVSKIISQQRHIERFVKIVASSQALSRNLYLNTYISQCEWSCLTRLAEAFVICRECLINGQRLSLSSPTFLTNKHAVESNVALNRTWKETGRRSEAATDTNLRATITTIKQNTP